MTYDPKWNPFLDARAKRVNELLHDLPVGSYDEAVLAAVRNGEGIHGMDMVLVCIRYYGQLDMTDNVLGNCSDCDHAIQFRPMNKPFALKVCVECAPGLLESLK